MIHNILFSIIKILYNIYHNKQLKTHFIEDVLSRTLFDLAGFQNCMILGLNYVFIH